MAVAIVIDESAAGVPALAIRADAGFFRDVGKRSVSVVVEQNIFAERGDVNVVEAIVVVIADANALSPTVMNKPGFRGDVGERTVAIVFEDVRDRFLPFGKTFEAPTIHPENIYSFAHRRKLSLR